MTMSSDEEGPALPRPSVPGKAKPSGKLTRKEQLALRKVSKPSKKASQKRKRVEGSDQEEEEEEVIKSDDEQNAMDGEFHFDGLGGGFVGERRMQVWVRSKFPANWSFRSELMIF